MFGIRLTPLGMTKHFDSEGLAFAGKSARRPAGLNLLR